MIPVIICNKVFEVIISILSNEMHITIRKGQLILIILRLKTNNNLIII